MITCAAQRNRHHVEASVAFIDDDYAFEEVLLDPQTSGGLLIACAPEDSGRLLERLRCRHAYARIIGQITEKTEKDITVL